MMEKFSFEINMEKIRTEAHEYFINNVRISNGNEKSKKMLEAAYKINDEIEKSLKIKSSVSPFDNFVMEEDTLIVENISFRSNPFSLIRRNQIMAVYFYIITAGDFYFEDRKISDQLYADMWLTSYLDAGRKNLRKDLLMHYYSKLPNKEAPKEVTISDSFGPGFYGMNTKDVEKIFQLVDSAEIQVECMDSGIMLPLKSCAGIYMIVEEGTLLPELKCENCIGNRMNCNMCNVKGDR
jgi:hypothetical protein